MENYICINGKKAELTEEQMKALGIEIPKNSPFERVEPYQRFYFINSLGEVVDTYDGGTCNIGSTDDDRFDIANYCTNKEIMEQRALHETLNRLLWRYSMEHDGDKIDWCDPYCLAQYYIAFNVPEQRFEVIHTYYFQHLGVYFRTREIANNAIKEIIVPFMKTHPEFKW